MIYNFLSDYLSIIIFLFIAFIFKEYRTEGSIFVDELMLIFSFLDENDYQLTGGGSDGTRTRDLLRDRQAL